jgi:hypothetical protein
MNELAKRDRVDVLDIGGSIRFWQSDTNSTLSNVHISIVNVPGAYDDLPIEEENAKNMFKLLTGDARNLSEFGDKAFDLIVCNSVIEHVGSWSDMSAAAAEALRVGKHGWVQVPAFEFPIEQHYILPLIHWFADPIQMKLLQTFHWEFRRRVFDAQIGTIEHIRPLTRSQLRRLFPHARIWSEWLIFPKSHIATW